MGTPMKASKRGSSPNRDSSHGSALPPLSESVRKRVRTAIAIGDQALARKQIRQVIDNEADVETWYTHLAEEKARQDEEEYERLFGGENQETDEDLLLRSMESLSIDSVPCPVCDEGDLQEGSNGMITCSTCLVKFTSASASLGELRDKLGKDLNMHALNCMRRPKFSINLDNRLQIACHECGLINVI